jgi:D-alanyl-D-alanine carboxypeptidase (penicillin-binding protein 5/6)
MRLIIILFVVVLHLAVLAWLLGSCHGRRTEPPRETPAEQVGDAEHAQQSARPAADAPGRDSAPAEYSDDFFADAVRPLPAALAERARICKAGVLIDWTRRLCLWDRNSTRAYTKMMTVLLLMRDLERRDDLSLSSVIPVTASAAKVGGRQVWLDPRESFSLDDLLQCILIRSANDCAYLVAEFLGGGDQKAFVARMNRTAAAMGLDSFTFYNSHGLPVSGSRQENVGSPRQLAYLAGLLMHYEDVVKWSSTRLSYIREDTKPFQLVNTNKLIDSCPGVNGMKTGYTSKSGYCLTATCARNGREVIAVALGCPSGKSRDELVRGLIEWAYTLD